MPTAALPVTRCQYRAFALSGVCPKSVITARKRSFKFYLAEGENLFDPASNSSSLLVHPILWYIHTAWEWVWDWYRNQIESIVPCRNVHIGPRQGPLFPVLAVPFSVPVPVCHVETPRPFISPLTLYGHVTGFFKGKFRVPTQPGKPGNIV